jgi:hypothetical protein
VLDLPESVNSVAVPRVLPEFLAQVADMHIDAAVEWDGPPVEDLGGDLVSAQHPAGGSEQCRQNIELGRCKLHKKAGAGHRSGRNIHLQIANTDLFATVFHGAGTTATTQDGADASHQLPGIKGLGKIVVSAKLQADDPVHIVAPFRQHKDRELGRRATGRAKLAQNFQPSHAREHHIHDRQVIPPRERLIQAGRAIVDSVHIETLTREILIE